MVHYGEGITLSFLQELSRGPSLNAKKLFKDKRKVNPLFEECLKYVDKEDQGWVEIFQNAAMNKFPKYFKYNKDKKIIFFTHRKDKENIKISDDIKTATQDIIKFFKDKGRIWSEKDYKDFSIEKKPKHEIKEITWKDIKNQKIRDNFICNYAADLVKKYNISEIPHYRKIKNIIYVGFSLGKITEKNIFMKNYKIETIDSLKWNAEKGMFYLYPDGKVNMKRSNKKIGYFNDEKIKVFNFNKKLDLVKDLKLSLTNFYKDGENENEIEDVIIKNELEDSLILSNKDINTSKTEELEST